MQKWRWFWLILLASGMLSAQMRVPYPQPPKNLGNISDMLWGHHRLWVLCDQGLWFHDGQAWGELLLPENELLPETESIALSDSGLWLGFHAQGLAHFHLKKEKLQRMPAALRLPDQRVGRIFMPTDTGIWFQTHHQGISFWSNKQQLKNLLPTSHPATDSTHRGQNIVTHAETDQAGKGLWVATLNGLLFFDWKQQAFTRYFSLSQNQCKQGKWTPQASAVRHFVLNGDSAWLATYGGLIGLDLQSGHFRVFWPEGRAEDRLPANMRSVIKDGSNRLRIVQVGSGIRYFDLAQLRFEEQVPTYTGAYAQLKCAVGMYTASPNKLVLECAADAALEIPHFFRKVPLRDMRTLTGGGLGLRYADDANHWTVINEGATQEVEYRNTYYGLHPVAATHEVLTVWFDRIQSEDAAGHIQTTPYPWGITDDPRYNVVSSFWDNEQALLWIGTKEMGVFVYHRKQDRWVAYTNAVLKKEWINGFCQDGSHMWVVSEQSLHQLDSKGDGHYRGKVRPAGVPAGSIFNELRVIDGRCYLLSKRNGLFVYSQSLEESPEHAIIPTDWQSEQLFDFEVYEDQLWLGLETGLLVVRGGQAELYGRHFGLGPVYRMHRQADRMLLMSRDQLWSLSFGELPERTWPEMPLTLSHWRVQGNRVGSHSKEAQVFSHDENSMELAWSGGDFRAPGALQWQYRLLGGEPTWKPLREQRMAFYELGHGEYALELRPIATDLGVGPVQTIARWQILQPWWQTPWFVAALLVVLLALGMGAYRYQLKQQRLRQRLEYEYRDQMRELELRMLRVQMNPHFIFNALNSVRYYILKKDRQEASDYLVRFARLLRFILNTSQKEMISLQEELDGLGNYIAFERMRFGERFDWTMEIDREVPVEQLQIWPMLMQPFVENAIWHGLMPKEHEARLKIVVGKQDHFLRIVIEDNGIGRKAAAERRVKAHPSHGLSITADRLRTLSQVLGAEAHFQIDDLAENGVPAGTRVTLLLPYESMDRR